MHKTEIERRAFLRTLKPRLVEITRTAAERSGPVDHEQLLDNVDKARKEHQRTLGLELEREAVPH